MPYTPPGTLTAADRNLSSERNHHRSRSFTDEKGPGAFAPLAIPRRNARPGIPKLTMPGGPPSASFSISTAASSASVSTPPAVTKSPKFELHAGSSEDSEEEDEAADAATAAIHNPLASKIMSHGTSSPTVHGHSAPLSRPVPFPSLSITASSPMQRSVSSPQIASPSAEQPSPSIYRSPYSSLRAEPSTRDKFPLKPALKSNHSSPHLPSLAHQRALTQSAPSTPNIPKTAWAMTPSDGGSAPGSPGSTYSVPQTPKSVHFASEKSVLESVVVFSKGARPRSLSNPGGYDTETETEGYDSTAGSGRYPFPAMPKNEVVPLLDEAASSEVPMKRALGSNGYGVSDERHYVYLETIMLPGTRPPTLRGSILVRNVAFQKRVAVRFTLDDWQTISEVSCNYSASLPNIPPPFSSSGSSFAPGHSRSATVSGIPSSASSGHLPISNGKAESWDRFTFTIKLEDVERTLPNKRMFLVVRYQVPSQWGWETGGEWWDNNADKNYEFAFKIGKKATANSGTSEEGGPSALVARGLASMNRGHDDSPVTRTQSLPPLPPPGPVRSAPSPLSLSPNNSVLGLGGLGKAKPVLEPLVSSGPKLRAGRGPTFAHTGSPRGSPPGSPVGRNSPTRAATNYTPPLPGSVPGITHGITSPNLAGLDRPAAPPAPKPVVAAEPAPAPAPAPPAPTAQVPKPQGLTISTANLSPTTTVGKKRGLSLSNYVSPTMVKSPSSHSNSNSMQNLASLMGGDGGENAYTNSKPTLPYVYTPPSTIGRKDSQNGPLTPGSLRMVGGMPATIIDENGSAPVERVPSWDIPLNGFWNALGEQKSTEHQKKASDSEDSSSSEDQVGLPTPPESSADSTLSTPDLERSPEAESVSFDDEKRKESEGDRDTPTPTLVSSAPVSTSTVPFPRSSPTGSPRSSDGGNTVRHVSPELPTPQSSDAESRPPTLSSLGRRTSLQTGQTMRLDLPQRPKFDLPPAEELSPTNHVRRASPSASSSSSSGSDSGSASKSGLAMKSGKSKKRRDQPDATPVPQFGLGLNMGASPASGNGPPPEFLAKYCFFVSSPGVSPPTTTSPANSSAVTSPSAGSFGTGVDTPRASSPGLASTAAWWGYSSNAVPERA
ncbi:Protein phosphatase 1 regulatory subunit 3D [Tulasnella sp. 425]|nr:Protein phosphatase 1 regulatory subunit 3D [Tulasnella sp. 425]